MDDTSPFTILGRERLHDGFLRLDRYLVTQRLFQGGETPPMTREVVLAREAVAVLCYDPRRDCVVLVEQARLAAEIAGFPAVSTEIPAGLMDGGDTPEASAIRELAEETGLAPQGKLIPITHLITTPGHSTETVHLFCALVDASVARGYHGLASEHEDIRLVVLPFDVFTDRLADGSIANSFSLVAGFWLMLNRERLRAAGEET